MGKRLIILILSLFIAIIIHGQNKTSQNEKLIEANAAFNNGDYEKASSLYRYIWAKYEDYEALSNMKKCEECKRLLMEGLELEGEQDYKSAIKKYNEISFINPDDKSVSILIQKCKERENNMVLEKTKLLYNEGKYQQALKTYREYQKNSGNSDETLFINIQEGINISQEAEKAFEKGQYEKAKELYMTLITRNPTDLESTKYIAQINDLTRKIITVKIDNGQNKKKNLNHSFKPEFSRFNMYLYSGFMSPVIIGGGISFNYSFFNLGIDAGGCESNNIKKGKLYKEDEDKVIKDEKGNFVEGKVQVVITPGINLKYFSVGLGFGAFLTKDLINPQYDNIFDFYQGTDINKARFLLRPTIMGFIPFNKDFSGGMDIMAGYNLIPQLKSYNQFLVGIGFFF